MDDIKNIYHHDTTYIFRIFLRKQCPGTESRNGLNEHKGLEGGFETIVSVVLRPKRTLLGVNIMDDRELMHRSWDALAEFYHSLSPEKEGYRSALGALEELCISISQSHLNMQLFAHTSHDRLMISQTKSTYPPPINSEFLVLEPHVSGDLRL